MKGIIRSLALIKDYKKSTLIASVALLFSAAFSLFTLLMIIPFLTILFDPPQNIGLKPEFALNSESFSAVMEYYIGFLVNKYGSITALIAICAILITNSFLKNAFRYLAQFILAKIRYGIVRDIRNTTFRKVVHLPLGYFTSKKKGDLFTRLTSDIQILEHTVLNTITILIKEPATIIIYMASLFIISWKLTLIVMIITPLSGFFVGRLAKKLKQNLRITQTLLAELNSIVDETLSGIRIISGFSAQLFQIGRFEKMNDHHYRKAKRVRRQHSLSSPMSEFLGTGMVVIVLFIGSWFVMNGNEGLSAEAFIGYLIVFSQILNPAKSFSSSYFTILKGLASLDRIEEVLKVPTTEHDTNYLEIPEGNFDLEIKQLSFEYEKDSPVISNLSVHIPFGKSLALVGQSGSGKSTLADLIAGFYQPSSGEILYAGINIKKFHPIKWRKKLGLVSQQAILFNDTAKENIDFGRNLSEHQIQEAVFTANANDFIAKLPKQLETNLGEGGNKLSGGQKQRMTIARAIAAQPEILILDEATSALDTESEQKVQLALEQVTHERTSIIIAHRLSTVRNADQILVIQDGNVLELGNHNELLAKEGHYAKMVNNQSLI